MECRPNLLRYYNAIRCSNNIISDGDIMSDYIIIGAVVTFMGIFLSPWMVVLGIIIALAGVAGD